ncbi:MAG: hypothetical protein AB7E52_02500 [Bdellovibrionales bacterium]
MKAPTASLHIAPLTVINGSMTPPAMPQDIPQEVAQAAKTVAPIIELKQTSKRPYVAPIRIRPDKVKVAIAKPLEKTTTARAHLAKAPQKHSTPRLSLAQAQVNISATLAKAKALTRNHTPDSNKAALFAFHKAFSLAQRHGLDHQAHVKQMYVECAKLYMGVPGIGKNLTLAARTAAAAGPNNCEAQSLITQIFVEDPTAIKGIGPFTPTGKGRMCSPVTVALRLLNQ